MRIFTTMLVALLTILGGCNLKAQVKVTYESTSTPANEITTGYYVIKAKYKTIDPCYLYMTGNKGKFSAEVETSSFKNVWSVEVNSDNSFYLKNVATGQYLKCGTNTQLSASNTKSGGSAFSANADYQVSGNITKLGEHSFVLYQGTPTTTEQRQVIHADGSSVAGLTMSSWITTPQATIGSSSAIGQFEFYKIKETNGSTPTIGSANALYYLMNANGQFLSGEVSGGATASQNSNASAYKFIVNRNANGQNYYINIYDEGGNKTLNAGGSYIWRMGYATPNSAQGNKEYWVIEPIDGLNAFSIKSVAKNSYLVATSNGAAAGFAGSIGTNGSWYFIPANESAIAARDLNLNIKSGDNVHGNLATFSATYPVALPEGCTAYTATHDADNNVINIAELAGNVIPANTGVLIKSESTGEVAMKPTLEAGTTVTDNKLEPVGDAEKTFTDDEKKANTIYLLGKQNDTFCFRLMNNEGEQKIGAHKAYIQLDNAAQATSLQINFGGNVTNISHAAVNEANTTSAVYYDLSGRRVMRPQHGLYIVNGKKVIIK